MSNLTTTTDEGLSNLSDGAKNAGGGVSVSTHFFEQRYLYAFAPQAEVYHHIRTQAVPSDTDSVPEVMESWQKLQPRVAALAKLEAGLADTIQVRPVSAAHHAFLDGIRSDALFQRTFSNLRTSFEFVEVDKLVAPQRNVNLDYVERLKSRFPKTLGEEALLQLCLSTEREMDPIQHLEIGQNTHVFSSPNSDIRLLGSFVKKLTPHDLEYAVAGGIPAAAVITFVGYGGSPINVIKSGSRIVLNNGFHRVYALRLAGVTHVPVVVQHIQNFKLECPPSIAGLPREYLYGDPRPVLLKDFFEPDFAITMRVKDRIKTVTVGISGGQHEVPA